jgi:hypothetical protein
MRKNGYQSTSSSTNFATDCSADIALEHLKRASRRKGIYRVAARLVLSPSRPKSDEIFGDVPHKTLTLILIILIKKHPLKRKNNR